MRRLARLCMVAGIAATVLGLSKLHAVRHGYVFHGSFRFGWALTYAALLGVAAYAAGLPDLTRRHRLLMPSIAAVSSAAVAISLAQLAVGSAVLPRVVVFGSAVLLVPWFVLCGMVCSNGRIREETRDRVIVVGGHDEAETLRLDLDDGAERPGRLVAVLPVAVAAGRGDGAEPLVARTRADHASVVVLSRAAQDEERIVEQAALLHESGLRVRTLAKFYEDWLGKLPIPELERVSLMFDIRELHRDRYARLKRVLDLTLAIPGFVALAGVLPFVLLGNAIANRGPLFYRQERVGRDGERFRILKLRTMRAGDGAGPYDEWTTEDDPRITAFGRLLRRTHLDELPQVVNILHGDLSVVGPRPEQPHYVEELTGKIPFYALRHLVRPGLTGWAQVKFGYAGDERDALEKLQYDFFYLRHQGLGLDLRIIGRTLRELVGRGGR